MTASVHLNSIEHDLSRAAVVIAEDDRTIRVVDLDAQKIEDIQQGRPTVLDDDRVTVLRGPVHTYKGDTR